MAEILSRSREAVASVGGTVLSAGVAALGTVTGRTKPFHPRGDLGTARLVRHGGPTAGPGTGSPWIDEPGSDEAIVRMSGGLGLPPGWPDVQGLALSTGAGVGRSDVLFAGTGTGPVSRHLLLPSRAAGSRVLGTLLPYRSAAGPLYLFAVPVDRGFSLSWAGLTGPRHEFARLEINGTVRAEDAMTFDPVLHVPRGLAQYGWVRALREPAYATARRRSGRSQPAD